MLTPYPDGLELSHIYQTLPDLTTGLVNVQSMRESMDRPVVKAKGFEMEFNYSKKGLYIDLCPKGSELPALVVCGPRQDTWQGYIIN